MATAAGGRSDAGASVAPGLPPGLTPDAVAAALAAYPIGGALVAGAFEASSRNDNLLVVDGHGARFVLRRYRRVRSTDRIRFQLRVQQFLDDAGFPVPGIIGTLDADQLAVIDGVPWALCEYVDGSHYDFAREAQLGEAGRRFAEFHVATRDLAEPHAFAEASVDPPDYWTDGEAELDRLRAIFPGTEFDEEFTFLRSWMEALRRDLPLATREALPSGWLHMDYHGRNTLFRGDSIVALLDFDDLMRGPFALDLGDALFMFCRPARGSQDIRPEAVRIFVGAYESIRPLQPGERAGALAFMGMSTAPFVAYYEMLLRNGEDAGARFHRYVELMRNRRRNAEQLQEALGGGFRSP